MVWAPQFQVFDERPIKANLIGYFEANQADALVWANDGTALPEIKKFYKSPRPVTVFPALTFLQSEHKDEARGDLMIIDFALLLELAIIHGKQDVLDTQSKRYSMALESMLANIPATTFFADSIIQAQQMIFAGIQVQYDVQGKFKSGFIDVLQIRTGWQITASLFG
jgi:hypothetical protein